MATAIIVAGGSGDRLGSAGGKQLIPIDGLPMLTHAIRALDSAALVERLVVVCHADRIDEYVSGAIEPAQSLAPITVVAGGDSRQASVASGLAAVSDDETTVVVHDGARPLVTPDIVDSAIRDLETAPDADAVIVAHPAIDTLKEVDAGVVIGTPDRSRLWAVQTPQVFRVQTLRAAHAVALAEGKEATDDAALVEANGGTVRVLEGRRDNIKVTVPEDVAIAEAILRMRRGGT